MLSPEEIERFQRHILLPEVGLVGQQCLRASRIVVSGSAGSLAAQFLRESGVGRVEERHDANIPRLHVSASGFLGRAWLLGFADGSACESCASSAGHPIMDDATEGFGVVAGTIAGLAVNAALQMLIEPQDSLYLEYNARELILRWEDLGKNPECPACGREEEPTAKPEPSGAFVPAVCEVNPGSGEISAEELYRRRRGKDSVTVIDVRERGERELGYITDSLWIPLSDVAGRLAEMDVNQEFVVYCKAGARSAKAVKIMRDAGFEHVWNLSGGILAWAERVDPSLPKY